MTRERPSFFRNYIVSPPSFSHSEHWLYRHFCVNNNDVFFSPVDLSGIKSALIFTYQPVFWWRVFYTDSGVLGAHTSMRFYRDFIVENE